MSNRKLFHGTMNASKSAQLLMQAFNLERQSKTFLIFKPEIDTRDKSVVRSRALNEERPAYTISKDSTGWISTLVAKYQPDFLFIDECQFFTPEQIEEFARISIVTDTPIFAYGLLLSYTGEMFEASKKAIECGFTLHELKMQCDFCHEKSTHHLLYIDGEVVKNGEPIHVGDQEFKSVCYTCYRKEINKSNK
jgi:thymidine kinase